MKARYTRQVFFVCIAALILSPVGCSRVETDSTGANSQFRRTTHTNFGSEIVLESYANIELRGHTFMVLTWRAPYDRPRDAYATFVHAIDRGGKSLFQFDHPLLNAAHMPTNLWEREPVKDVFQLTPPAGYSPGKYTLRVGVFAPVGGRQLEIFATDLPMPNDGWRNVAVLLANIECR
jgi:hypothetical protein